ncbi:hypothetical protein BC830DRAFT_1144922 [Chytriomyces sp. MP71]|nr:hypothetical protein BC830DRAFT_1144922 [Chytriomyces sp. MP71]
MTSVASRASANNASAQSLDRAVPDVPGAAGTQSIDAISVHSLARTGPAPAPSSNPSLKAAADSPVRLVAAEEGAQTRGAGPSPLGTAAPVLEGNEASDDKKPPQANDEAPPNQETQDADLNEQGERGARDEVPDNTGNDAIQADTEEGAQDGAADASADQVTK